VNGYLQLWLAFLLLSACYCCQRYLCRSQGWAQHSPGPAGFFYSGFSWARAAATSFPLSKHTGRGDTAPTFSGLRVCLQLTWEVGVPPSPVEFSSLRHSHKFSRSWLLGTCLRSHPLRPDPACLFIVLWGIPLSPPSALREPHPLCHMSLLFLLLIT
jgi:hypothetical protein